MANISLSGLESRAWTDLTRLLVDQGHEIAVGEEASAAADVLFCNADDPAHPEFVREIHTVRPDLPIIAVTEAPDPSKWLDALDAGAADYCTAPFETQQIYWLLSGILKSNRNRQ